LNLTPVSTPQINLVLNPAAMAQLGVTAQEVSVAASAAIGGNQATMFQPATGYPQPIRVISHTGTTINLQQIGLIPVAPATAMRGPVMLGQVATVTQAAADAPYRPIRSTFPTMFPTVITVWIVPHGGSERASNPMPAQRWAEAQIVRTSQRRHLAPGFGW
jgi:hypothetical protein